ncbi:MAG TPA: S-adenosylmethionine decarboxylase [Streptosporangiaceae bacterium]|nr:S-adenosylmethionine decarboxylase [Streptosporangiaceae bacterium]
MLHAVDASTTPSTPVADLARLTAAAMDAVVAGHGHVVGSSHVIFPNGAITLVLILAESHLSIHTWPEEDLIAIDLFSCGAIDAPRVIGELVSLLRLERVAVSQVPRGIQAARG